MIFVKSKVVYAGDDLKALEDLPNYQNWIMDSFRPYLNGRAVDIGAGVGTFSQIIALQVDKMDVVEPASNLIPLLKDNLDGIVDNIYNLSIEKWLENTESKSYNCVIMINVLEHIDDDKNVLNEIYSRLSPGGVLLLFVPALKNLFSPIDSLLGHYRRYSRSDLLEKVHNAGFSIVECAYRDFLGSFLWWIVYRRLGRKRFNPLAARFYDFVGIPLTRLIEKVVTVPFGKNLILIARR